MRGLDSVEAHGATRRGGRRRARYVRNTLMVTFAAGGAIALAACGSSGSSNASSTPPSSRSTSTASTAATVKTADNAQLGTILVDGQGRTLYTFTNGGQPVPCSGACASAWPPFTASSGAKTVSAPDGVTGLSTTSTSAGTQVAYKGLPLFRFSGDQAAGDANGEGIDNFGGVWHVVKVSASAGSSTTGAGTGGATNSGPTSTSSSSSGSGYGY